MTNHQSALDAPGENGQQIPGPMAILRTHPNQAYVTLGFSDKATCDVFLKRLDILSSRFYVAAPPAQSAPDGWQSIPALPEENNDDFYGTQYSVPELLRDGENVLAIVARWSFLDNGWVGADFREGPNPSDYDWLNEKPMRWLALSRTAAQGIVSKEDYDDVIR